MAYGKREAIRNKITARRITTNNKQHRQRSNLEMNDKDKLDMIDMCVAAHHTGQALEYYNGSAWVDSSNELSIIIGTILDGGIYRLANKRTTYLDEAILLVKVNGYEVVKKEPEVLATKAVKLDTGVDGFSIILGSDGVWLWFDSDRQSAGVNMTAIAEERKNPTRSCLISWINQTVTKYGGVK